MGTDPGQAAGFALAAQHASVGPALIELGALVVVLALLGRLAHRTGISPIPL